MDVKETTLKTPHANSFFVTLVLAAYSITNKHIKLPATPTRTNNPLHWLHASYVSRYIR